MHGTIQAVLLGAVRSHVPARPAARQSSVKSGELQAGGNNICLCLSGVALTPPQKATLDRFRTLL